MSCTQFFNTNPTCNTITTISPVGSTEALDESGSVILSPDQAIVNVTFNTLKATDNYRFEYLYIEVPGGINPGAIQIIVTTQTVAGFTVNLAGVPLADGYILRWRVIVQGFTQEVLVIDAPEELRVQINQGAIVQTFTFANPRSNTTYGFSELRVENLVDSVAAQRFIVPQVAVKTTTDFTVGFSAPPDTENYFLVIRTP